MDSSPIWKFLNPARCGRDAPNKARNLDPVHQMRKGTHRRPLSPARADQSPRRLKGTAGIPDFSRE